MFRVLRVYTHTHTHTNTHTHTHPLSLSPFTRARAHTHTPAQSSNTHQQTFDYVSNTGSASIAPSSLNYEIPSPTHTYRFILTSASLFQCTFTLIFISLVFFFLLHVEIPSFFQGMNETPSPTHTYWFILIFTWLFLSSHIEICITLLKYEIPSPTHTYWFIVIFASLFQFTFTLIFISLFLMIHIDIRIILAGDEWNLEPDIYLLIFIWLFVLSPIEIRITLSNHKIPSPTPLYRLKLKFISVPCWHSYQYSYWFTLSFESFSEIPNPTPICWYDMNRKTIVMAVYYSSDCNGATLISPRPQSLPLSLSLSPTLSHT